MKKLFLSITAALAIASGSRAQLVAHYDFNGTTSDVSGSGLNGTPSSTPTYVTGSPTTGTQAIQMINGSYVAVGYDNRLNLTTWTITAIVKLTSYNASDNRIVERFDTTGSRWGSDFMSTEVYSTKFYGYAASSTGVPTGPVVGTGQWVCLTATYDGTNLRTYVGGTLAATIPWTQAYNFNNKSPVLYIGSRDNNYGMIGAIDDIQIYKGALSATDIANACSGVPVVSTGNSWITTGNSIASNNNIFGTLTNDDVVIKTNGTQRGTITKGGRFGFGTGTAAPTATLHVDATPNANTQGIRFQGLPTYNTSYTQTVVADGNGNLALAPYSSSSYMAGEGLSLSGTNFQLGNACGAGGNPFTTHREVLLNSRNFYLNTSEIGKVYIGPGSCPGLTTRLELNSQYLPGAVNSYALGAPSSSGLRFTRLTNNDVPITNATKGVLSLDGEGDVIWVEDQAGTNNPNGGWALGGNSIATTPATYIGTNDTFDFNIYTGGTQRGRVMKDGNFDLGANTITGSTTISAAVGQGNTIHEARTSFIAGRNNTIRYTNYQYRPNNGSGCIVMGAGNTLDSSDESSVLGEDNIVFNTHGSFVGGGHNWIPNTYGRAHHKSTLYQGIIGCANYINDNIAYPTDQQFAYVFGAKDTILQGQYVNVVGNRNVVSANNTVVLGSQINNTADNAIVAGVNGVRTATITDRGLGVMVAPTSSSYVPNHNLEVDAQMTNGQANASNIAFFNLPVASNMPVVLVDPNTGELFMSRERNYTLTGNGNGPVVTDHQIADHATGFSNALELVQQINPQRYENNGTRYPSLKLADKKPTYGIIAQDMEKVLPGLVSDVPTGKDSETVKGVNYNELVPILVQAIKEQQQQIADLTDKLNKTTARQEQTENVIGRLDVVLSDKDIAVLDQNYPNPFDKYTTIGYFIPERIKTAIIQFSALDGKIVKSIELPSRGKGLINVYTSELAAGTYTYTLLADGKVIDTKKMQIIR